MSQETHQPQWFITADGTVIQSWPPGPGNDRLKYVRFSTNRRLELPDLYALDERLDHFKNSFKRRSNLLLLLIVLDVAGIALAWLILPRLGVGTNVMLVLTAMSILLLGAARRIARAISGVSRTSFEHIYLDAGFESSIPMSSTTVKRRLSSKPRGPSAGVSTATNGTTDAGVHGVHLTTAIR